jgi:hypothetical protein
MVTRVSGTLGPVLEKIRAAPLAHFDETGFRAARKLA